MKSISLAIISLLGLGSASQSKATCDHFVSIELVNNIDKLSSHISSLASLSGSHRSSEISDAKSKVMSQFAVVNSTKLDCLSALEMPEILTSLTSLLTTLTVDHQKLLNVDQEDPAYISDYDVATTFDGWDGVNAGPSSTIDEQPLPTGPETIAPLSIETTFHPHPSLTPTASSSPKTSTSHSSSQSSSSSSSDSSASTAKTTSYSFNRSSFYASLTFSYTPTTSHHVGLIRGIYDDIIDVTDGTLHFIERILGFGGDAATEQLADSETKQELLKMLDKVKHQYALKGL